MGLDQLIPAGAGFRIDLPPRRIGVERPKGAPDALRESPIIGSRLGRRPLSSLGVEPQNQSDSGALPAYSCAASAPGVATIRLL
jgi:hypothetical protein